MIPVPLTSPDVFSQGMPLGRDVRLQAHLRTTESVRETTASGLSVLRGWIELMAEGVLTEDEQEHAVEAARRRTDAIQTAVDGLIRTSTETLQGGRAVEVVDLGETVTRVLDCPLRGDGDHPMLIETHRSELEAFLLAAAPVLVPEGVPLGDEVSVPLVDAGSLSAAARSALTNSRGALAQGPAGVCATWKRPIGADVVNSAQDHRK